MAESKPAGCARPSGGPVEKEKPEQEQVNNTDEKVEEANMITINQKAPDFTAPAYHQGKFVNVNLSDYLGKWVSLCFYPGDFTFV